MLCLSIHTHSVSLATVHGGEDLREPQAHQETFGPGLRWELSRVPMLPVPTHRGLWRLWLGLDYCPQALQSQLLFWGMWVHALPEVPAHPSGEQGEPQRVCGPLLHPNKDVPDQHALLQPQRADHLRHDPLHGGGPLWMLMRRRPSQERGGGGGGGWGGGLWLSPALDFRLVDTTDPPVPVLSCRTRCNRTRVEATNSWPSRIAALSKIGISHSIVFNLYSYFFRCHF